MATKKHLASITILVEDRQTHAGDVQEILTQNGHIIMARLGVNVQKSCVEHCTGLIVVTIEATTKEINDLTRKLNALYGIIAKSNIMTK
jgi:hypothetical protein